MNNAQQISVDYLKLVPLLFEKDLKQFVYGLQIDYWNCFFKAILEQNNPDGSKSEEKEGDGKVGRGAVVVGRFIDNYCKSHEFYARTVWGR